MTDRELIDSARRVLSKALADERDAIRSVGQSAGFHAFATGRVSGLELALSMLDENQRGEA